MKSMPPLAGNLAVVRSYQLRETLTIKSMTTIGHVFVPLKREHDGMVSTNDDQTRFESLPVLLALWEPFEQRLSRHLSELTEGQIDREEMFWFDAAHVNAMIAVVEAEAVTAAPDLRDWLMSLAAFARRAADRHVGVVFVIS
jgi:hypothetical protein